MRSRLTKTFAIAVMALAAESLAACGSSSGKSARGPARGALAISVGDSSITAADSIPAGVTDVTVTATGRSRAHVLIDRLNDGVTFDQIEKASDQEQGRLGTVVGGNGAVGPGASTTVILDLAPGRYDVVQIANGNAASTHHLEVTATSATRAPPPAAKGQVVMKDRSFTLPSGFGSKGIWRVSNNDAKDDHEASVLQIAPGKTLDDVVAYFKSRDRSGPSPAIAMGGMGDLAAGHAGWMVLNLPPGSYALACFIPDDTGMPHVAMGMIAAFRVT